MRRILKIGPPEWYAEIGRHRQGNVECELHEGDPVNPDLNGIEYVIVHHEYVRHPDLDGLRANLVANGVNVAVHDPEVYGQRSPALPPSWPFFPMQTEMFAAIMDSIGDLWNIPV